MDIISEHTVEDAEIILQYLKVPKTESEYNILIASVNNLLALTEGDEDHPMAPLLEIIGTLVDPFERQHFNMF
jgi:HTH-type transcriptional regulator/antitoxin HigA